MLKPSSTKPPPRRSPRFCRTKPPPDPLGDEEEDITLVDPDEVPEKKEEEDAPVEAFVKEHDATEMQFGENEFVAVLAPENDDDDVFFLAVMNQDLCVGDKGEVEVTWYDHIENEQGVEGIKGTKARNRYFETDLTDSVDCDSLICALGQFITFCPDESEVLLREGASAFVDLKLKDQLRDDYSRLTDPDFGDREYKTRTKRKTRVQKARASRAKSKSTPTKARKRKRSNDDDDEEEEKYRKTSSRQPKTIKRGKKNPLIPRPDIEVVADPFTEKTGELARFEGDIHRASKEVIRAVRAGDKETLSAALKDTKTIHSLKIGQSVDLPLTAMHYALLKNDFSLAKKLFEDSKERAPLQSCELVEAGSGSHTSQYSHYNRYQIQATRGGKEGNNAFLSDVQGRSYKSGSGSSSIRPSFQGPIAQNVNLLGSYDSITWDTMQRFGALSGVSDLDENNICRIVDTLVEYGRVDLAKSVISTNIDHPWLGFNFLHAEALSSEPKAPFSSENGIGTSAEVFSKPVRAASAIKKTQTPLRFSPLHVAAINPKTDFLDALLEMVPTAQTVVDQFGRNLLHYAAVCSSDAPLALILRKFPSFNVNSLDSQHVSPLHLAARTGSAAAATALLAAADSTTKSLTVAQKSRHGYSALHYASFCRRSSRLDTITALIDGGCDPNAEATAGKNKLSAIHIASAIGDLDLVKLLVEKGAAPYKKDKLGRTPIVHAAKNGHAHVLSYLIQIGVDYEQADSSENYPLHYAVAYGWGECVDLLLKSGAHPNCKSSWSTTPLALATLKNRFSIASKLMGIDEVDVNFRDDKGATLIFRMVSTIATRYSEIRDSTDRVEDGDLLNDLPVTLRQLLERKEIKVGIPDTTKRSELHLIAERTYSSNLGQRKSVALTQFFVDRGLDPDAACDAGNTPVMLAAQRGNRRLLKLLLKVSKASEATEKSVHGKDSLLHLLIRSQGPLEFLKVFEETAPQLLRFQCHQVNASGFTPILEAAKRFHDAPSHQPSLDAFYFLLDKCPEEAWRPGRCIGPESLTLPANLMKKLTSPEDKTLDSSEHVKIDQAELSGKNILHILADIDKFVLSAPAFEKVLTAVSEEHRMLMTRALDTDGRTPLQILQATLFKNFPKNNSESVEGKKLIAAAMEIFSLLLKSMGKGASFSSPVVHPFRSLEEAASFQYDPTFGSSLVKDLRALLAEQGDTPTEEIVEKYEELMRYRDCCELFSKRKIDGKEVWVLDHNGWTPKHPAVEMIKVGVTPKFLVTCCERFDLDLDVVDCPYSQNSPFHLAVSQRQNAMFEALCGFNEISSKLLLANNNKGFLPFHIAINTQNLVIVDLILRECDVGTILEAKDNYGRTPLHLAIERAVERKDEPMHPIERKLLDLGANVTAQDNHGRSPLCYVFLGNRGKDDHKDFPRSLSAGQDPVEIVSMLVNSKNGAPSVNLADNDKRTPLHFASAKGAMVSALLLLARGASLSAHDVHGNSPLAVSIAKGHAKQAIMLLQGNEKAKKELATHHAFYDSCQKSKKSCFWYALSHNDQGLIYVLLERFPSGLALQDALSLGKYQLVFKLVCNCTEEVIKFTSKTTGVTLLHLVSNVRGNANWVKPILKKLVERGADMKTLAKNGQTPLHFAARAGNLEVCKDLIRSYGLSATTKDSSGSTPLREHFCSLSLNLELIKFLHSESKESLDFEVPCQRMGEKPPQVKMASLEVVSGPNVRTVLAKAEAEAQALARAQAQASTKPIYRTVSSPLAVIAFDKKSAGLLSFLHQAGANLDAFDSDGRTALHHAVLSGDMMWIHLLGKLSCDLNLPTRDGADLTPMMIAVSQHQENEWPLRALVRYGATPRKAGTNALHLAIAINHDSYVEMIVQSTEERVEKFGGKSASLKDKKPGSEMLVRFGSEPVWYCAEVDHEGGLMIPADGLLGEGTNDREVINQSIRRVVDNAAFWEAKFQNRSISQLENLNWRERNELNRENLSTQYNYSENVCSKLTKMLSLQKRAAAQNPKNIQLKFDEGDKFSVLFRDQSLIQPSRQSRLLELMKEKMPHLSTKDTYLLADAHLGDESKLIGDEDPFLTTKLSEGEKVLVQIGRNWVTWHFGEVEKASNNGTYHVKLVRGGVLKGVYRSSIRPCPQSMVMTVKVEKGRRASCVNQKDGEGKSPLELLVSPMSSFEGWSFENIGLAKQLLEWGAKVKDLGLTKTCRKGSPLFEVLNKAGGKRDVEMEDEEDAEMEESFERLISEEALTNDYIAAVKEHEKKTADVELQPPPLNPNCTVSHSAAFVLPTEEGDYYDVTLAVVEMSGRSGVENNFYRMQIVSDPVKSIFVLVTHWGRVDEYTRNHGKFQNTPFPKAEGAVAEFRKIFRAKTGNDWTQRTNFERKQKKYKLFKAVKKSKVHADLPLLVKPHQPVEVESKLPMEVQHALERFTNPSEISRVVSQVGVDNTALPLGILPIETILEAEKLIFKLNEVLERLKEAKAKDPPDFPLIQGVTEEVAILSSQFYELIPSSEEEGRLRPFLSKEDKVFTKAVSRVKELKQLSVATKLVIASDFKRNEVHPYDYCLGALGVKLSPVAEEVPERIAIEQYFRNTNQSYHDVVISNVFAVDREADIGREIEVGNRRLLWHGSSTANMLGLLKQGLLIAPPEAPVCGHLYGKGVYTADMFDKCYSYCRASLNTDCKSVEQKRPKAFLLLVEVGLGEEYTVTKPVYMEKSPSGFQSTVAAAKNFPNPKENVVTGIGKGVAVPLGKVVEGKGIKMAKWGLERKAGLWEEVDEEVSLRLEQVVADEDTEYPVKVTIPVEGGKEFMVELERPGEGMLLGMGWGEEELRASLMSSVDAAMEDGDKEKEGEKEGEKEKEKEGEEGKEGEKEAEGKGKEKEGEDVDMGDKEDKEDGEDESEEKEEEEEEEEEEKDEENEKVKVLRRVTEASLPRYHEFIVYDTKQVRIRYVVEVTSSAWLKNARKMGHPSP